MMKTKRYWLRILIFLFCLTNTVTTGEEDLTNPLFVSLGGCCEVAIQLRHNELRTYAYPFDWMYTLNHEKFLEILNGDFEFFLDKEYIFQNPENKDILENKYYECEFRHDPPINSENDLISHLQEIETKYMRRIVRFRGLRDYAAKVFFIRTAYDFQNGGFYYWWNETQEYITAEQAYELKQALDRYFPLLNFTLVIINYTEGKMEKIEHDDVIEFKIRKKHRTLDYKNLFYRLSSK